MDMNEDLEIRDELSLEIVSQEDADWALIAEAVSWCAVHHGRECSPMRNGCGLLDQQRQALARRRAEG
jgi:hypothetical protein